MLLIEPACLLHSSCVMTIISHVIFMTQLFFTNFT